ncbi:hypothetical protein CBM2586_B10217 [Cupriavidus phytorum]|uniref:DnaT DNA-binding domain-containing protein n=1 Tax=Cupriavidus taiwanensis TaxID=164546 RepID=A0A375C948_9BURK|nr:hypothetical protein [Cupriavidus taiwanensis]SOY65622.1 hypothetical protein CBM2586_B10217 [Cupriavidus taiwanensis]
MAGDWIKMRTNLWNDPRVSRLVDLTDTTEATVIGGLYWVWATADEHSLDGAMPGLTLRAVDRKTGVSGLADALVDVGWLEDHPEGVRLVRFDEHNGASAKTRAQTAKRVANHRSNCHVTDQALQDEHGSVTDALAREEKRREEKKEGEKTARASRLPADWQPSFEEIEFCRAERPDLSPESVASQFRDYWIAQPGAKGRKADWMATWRNWVRNQRGGAPKGAATAGQQTANSVKEAQRLIFGGHDAAV